MEIDALRTLWSDDLARTGWAGGPIAALEPDPDRTWVWSDLHLSDRGVLEAFDRPFGTVEAMNRRLLTNWRRQVRRSDTIICLGDVAHPNTFEDRRLMLDLNECPGERIVILGNHDLDRAALADASFSTQYDLALCDTDPPLALSHYPLRRIPPGAVNLHGHLHEGTEPTPLHINLVVERLGYRPWLLATVLAEARRNLRRWIG